MVLSCRIATDMDQPYIRFEGDVLQLVNSVICHFGRWVAVYVYCSARVGELRNVCVCVCMCVCVCVCIY
jgi:hypothetical protein